MKGGIVTNITDDHHDATILVVKISDRPPSCKYRQERLIFIERNRDSERIEVGDRLWINSFASGGFTPSQVSSSQNGGVFRVKRVGPVVLIDRTLAGAR